jgi:hypothetical protein
VLLLNECLLLFRYRLSPETFVYALVWRSQGRVVHRTHLHWRRELTCLLKEHFVGAFMNSFECNVLFGSLLMWVFLRN